MQPSTILIIMASLALLVVLGGAVYLAMTGNVTARYFLWSWAVLLMLAAPISLAVKFSRDATLWPVLVLGGLFLVALFFTIRQNTEKLEESHEETRRVLAESNSRIEDERRLLSRIIHDDINPNILLCRNEMHRLQALVKDNEKAAAIAANAGRLLNEAYLQLRGLIQNTRIEVIDSIGFTAAVESLFAHYRSCFEKPSLALEHNLPARPELAQEQAINAYKILREALFNAIKHANAKEVQVVIERTETNWYRISIQDDGVGVQRAKEDTDGSGIGLIDMRERARVIGAALTITTVKPGPKPGTRVFFEFEGRPPQLIANPG